MKLTNRLAYVTESTELSWLTSWVRPYVRKDANEQKLKIIRRIIYYLCLVDIVNS